MPYLLFSNSSILDISLYPLQISFIVSHVSKQVALLMMMKQEGGSITNHDWVPLDTSISYLQLIFLVFYLSLLLPKAFSHVHHRINLLQDELH
jgi:hypothetical protein